MSSKTNSMFIVILLQATLVCTPVLGEQVELEHGSTSLTGNLEKSQGWPEGPTLLITHGTLSHNHSEIISALQSTLLEYEVSSLAINLSLAVDARSGPYDCARPHRHLHQDATEEIGRWLAWLESQGARKIYPTGHSRGAVQTVAFVAPATQASVAGLVLIAPPPWDGEKLAQDFATANGVTLAQTLDDAAVMKPEQLIEQIDFLYCRGSDVSAATFLSYYGEGEGKDTPRLLADWQRPPILLLLGSEDTLVPKATYSESSLGPGVTLRVIEGADHFFRDLYLDEAVEFISEFVGE